MCLKYEAIIFDWAGTTVDYGCFAPVQAFVAAFQTFGITPTIQEVREPMGMLKIDHVRAMLSMERITKLWKEIYGAQWTEADVNKVYQLSESKIMEILPDFAEPKPYVVQVMEELRNMGLKIGSTTGYTDEMMSLVAPAAAAAGYRPDCWFSPDSTKGVGRPYPYMIFRNMEALHISSVKRVLKVGDTISDMKEGIHAGMETVGIVEGSSIMGLSENEFQNLSEEEKNICRNEVVQKFKDAGADFVMNDVRGLLEIIQ